MGILTGISGLLPRLYRLGVEGSMDPRVAKRIVLSNQISFWVALLTIPHVFIYAFTDAGIMGWFRIPFFLGYLSVLYLNRAGRTWFSRIWAVTVANLDILFYTLLIGRGLGLHLYFLLAACAPLVIFNWGERKSIAYGFLLSSVFFLGSEAFVPADGLLSPIAPAYAQPYRFAQTATLILVQALFIVYFHRGNRATEKALAQAGDEARAADEAKSRFLAKMSDEIRIPLNEILNRAEALIMSGMDTGPRETLDDIRLSAHDLLAIVDELLDLSRIESGQMTLERAPFSPMRLGHSVLRPFEFEAGKKGLKLSLDCEPGIAAHVLGDASRIRQVLRNLIGNAFKFTDKGEVALRIRAANAGHGADAHSLIFEIEDTGIGVPDALRGRIFEPFSQADASTTRKYGGTGLGLFIGKKLVELMGGEIGLRAKPAGGSVFHFRLPLPKVEPAAVKPEKPRIRDAGTPAAKEPLPPGARALRILVVDDHALNRKVLESFLESYGLTADMAVSGDEALRAFGSSPYHLVFMDCHMPGMDGYECTRRIRQGSAPGSRTTIIGVTADAMENTLGRCMAAGMDGLLTKPIMEKDLRALLADCAGKADPPPLNQA
jgi:signal transduction histidine kinase/ActR/RegA family two-component response regulator